MHLKALPLVVRVPDFHPPRWPGFYSCSVTVALHAELRILLCESEAVQHEVSIQELGLAGLGELSVVMVPKNKPITRKQFEVAAKLWPTHFHEDKM